VEGPSLCKNLGIKGLGDKGLSARISRVGGGGRAGFQESFGKGARPFAKTTGNSKHIGRHSWDFSEKTRNFELGGRKHRGKSRTFKLLGEEFRKRSKMSWVLKSGEVGGPKIALS